MTNILRKITCNHEAVQAMHAAIENKPFLQRYVGKTADALTLLDHYRHLVQLKAIYTTFSALLSDFHPEFPEHLLSLLQRAEHIEADLNFLDAYVTDPDKSRINNATTQYVSTLGNLPKPSLLIHFLVATLGDLNGGQFLKSIVRNLYLERGLVSDKQSEAGIRFYIFEKSIGSQLTAWLRTFITFNDDDAPDYGDDFSAQQRGIDTLEAFKMQTMIVEELEATRKSTRAPYGHFFGCPSAKTAALIGGAALAAGIAISRIL